MVLGLGPLELVVILLVVLVIFGPKNLPKLGSAMGKTVKNIREGMEDDEAPKADAEPEPEPVYEDVAEEEVDEEAAAEEAARKAAKKAAKKAKKAAKKAAEAAAAAEATEVEDAE